MRPDFCQKIPPRRWRDTVAAGIYRSGMHTVAKRFVQGYELLPKSERGFSVLRRVSKPKFLVLCYHRIGTGGVPLYSALPAKVFEDQMRLLRKHYRVVSLDQLCHELREPSSTQHAIAITFDDGYRGTYTEAFPILERYQIPATVFLTVQSIQTGEIPWYDRVFLALQLLRNRWLDFETDVVRRFDLTSPQARFEAALEIVKMLRRMADSDRREWCRTLEKKVVLPDREIKDRMMTWEQVNEMHRSGILFGSHTMTHPVIAQLSRKQIEQELSESKHIIEEKVECSIHHFAYPFGQPSDCGTDATPVLASLGYSSAATTVWGFNSFGTSPYCLRRVDLGEERSLPMFALKLNLLLLPAENPRSATVSDIWQDGIELSAGASNA